MSARREARKRGLAIAGIVLFLLVDILLVALALQSTAPRPAGASTASEPPPSASAPTGEPTPAETPAAVTAAMPTRILSALDADVIWRATTGPCPDAGAAPELSVDGGETWTSADLTGATGLSALQRIFVSGPATATFLGAGEDCAPDAARTFVAGDDFAGYPDQLTQSWYLTPVGSASLHSPSGATAAPCESAVSVAPLDSERAGVLCADSSLHLTVDGGTSWSALAPLPGAIAVTEMSDGLLVASAGAAECAGVLLTSMEVDDSRVILGCVQSDAPSADLAGATAIDWTEGGIWMWVDERLLFSTDEGETWV